MAYHDDVDIYEQVARELESGDLIKGLWLKCLADSGGDKQLAEAVYVKARAFQLKEEAEAERDRKERESASEHMSKVDRDRMHADALAENEKALDESEKRRAQYEADLQGRRRIEVERVSQAISGLSARERAFAEIFHFPATVLRQKCRELARRFESPQEYSRYRKRVLLACCTIPLACVTLAWLFYLVIR
jgi:hypothetical protein